MDSALSSLKQQFSQQSHVFNGIGKINAAQQHELIANLKAIDLKLVDQLCSVVKADAKGEVSSSISAKIEPFKNVTLAEKADSQTRANWKRKGLQMIADGKVAALLMAGGQGTRLGSDLPKGQYDIGLPSGKSMFQLQAERLQTLHNIATKAAEGSGTPSENVYGLDVAPQFIPWYIMTSPATNQPSIDFFESHDYFGYPKEYVFFFEQGTLPCLTTDGKLIMESFTTPSRSPNGNGGIYSALGDSGMLDDMKTRGVSHVFIYSVDNVLVQVADPEFIGYCALNNVDFGNKVLEKVDPSESVGVLAMKDGKAAVVEYSEMPGALAQAKNPDGSLVYRAANIAIHCVSVPFIDSAIATSIPYHVAHKKIPYIDSNGTLIKPDKNNGVKLEMFIFDGLALAKNPCAFMVKRQGNFSAVKNGPGKQLPDSPDTARDDVSQYHMSLIQAAGGSFTNPNDHKLCEISPLISYNGENLEPHVKGKVFTLPLHLK
uniref:UDP-N-acetylglucosamine diphosphorylase n=1 Tax=Spongospora subterranea TaxID=70186 RepID=A0A0H5QNC6_9EUKA|eukprot:CRZ03503.1 hypothetical protein [Spongospora subterranea]